jgi:acetyltransferase-like isoleucine patch superfamily enzyme
VRGDVSVGVGTVVLLGSDVTSNIEAGVIAVGSPSKGGNI